MVQRRSEQQLVMTAGDKALCANPGLLLCGEHLAQGVGGSGWGSPWQWGDFLYSVPQYLCSGNAQHHQGLGCTSAVICYLSHCHGNEELAVSNRKHPKKQPAMVVLGDESR